MVAAKRVLGYLKGTPDLCVRYSIDFTLHGYSDASHSDSPNNSRSVSGYLYMFAGRPVTWSSKKQPVDSLSSCESEYIALAYGSQEAVFMYDLSIELTFPHFLLCRCTRTTWELFSYQVLQHSRQGPNTFVQDTVFCASWMQQTRSPYLMSRQQISWRTFSPNSWTARSLKTSWTR